MRRDRVGHHPSIHPSIHPSSQPAARRIDKAHIWRNDITGLRAAAVLPVLLFHAFPQLLPGGFFGVDIFFVISGYLISGIIFRELIAGAFSYKTFYAKRIKRILPNLLLLFAFVSIAGYVFLLPIEYANLGKHIYSSAAFFQNFRLLSEVGYFTEDALRKPLLHLWSLAIEEQFYIVFPILCALIWRVKKARVLLLGAAAALIVSGSFAACLWVRDLSFNFYFPLTRFWELGFGILLAYVESYGLFRPGQMAKGLRSALSCIGLVLVLAPMAAYSASWRHPGIVTLLPVLGSVLLIAAHADAVVNRTLLSWRPMTYVGLISYSLYLWHWPLLAFLFLVNPSAPAWCTVLALILSLLLSSAVYRYVENPVRRSRTLLGVSTVKVLLVGLLLAVAVGQTIRKTDGMPFRGVYPEIDRIRAVGEWDAYRDAEKLKFEGVDVAVTLRKEVPEILFAGDSHAVQYGRRIEALSVLSDRNAGMMGEGGKFVYGACDNPAYGDAALTKAFYKLLEDRRVKTVVVASIWGQYASDPGFAKGLEDLKKAVQKRGDLKLFVLLDAPWTPAAQGNQQGDYDPLRHFNRWAFSRADFVVPYPKDDVWKRGNEAVVKALGDAAEIISVEEHVCSGGMCDLYEWYRDDDHLQPVALEEKAVWLNPIFGLPPDRPEAGGVRAR